MTILLNKCCSNTTNNGTPNPNISYQSYPLKLNDKGNCPPNSTTTYRVVFSGNNGYSYTTPDSDLSALSVAIDTHINNIINSGVSYTYDNWERTLGVINQADRWRINGGSDIMFPNGMVNGTAIFNEIIATLPQVKIVGVQYDSLTNVGTITTIYRQMDYISEHGQSITMEIWNGSNWEPLANLVSSNTTPTVLNFPPPPTGCINLTIYASNCDGTNPGSIAGNTIAVGLVIRKGGFINYPAQIYSPFGAFDSLGNATDNTSTLELLNTDPANTNSVYFANILNTSLGATFLVSASDCSHIPISIPA